MTRNAVTVDEFIHLPVGLRYWDTAQFWAYHHNPPLTRLAAALPMMLSDVPRHHGDYGYTPEQRWADTAIGEDFQRLHRDNYLDVFVAARWMGVALALLGGWVVWRWARELFGDAGGLSALALWTFCPFVLAHAGLVTPDVGATSLMIAATYMFWRYLRSPSAEWCVGSGVLLGLAEASKFTAVVLPGIWIILAVVRFAQRDHAWGPRPALWRLAGHSALLTAVGLATLNTVYLWEGTGRQLGDFPLRSPSLTKAAARTQRMSRDA